MVASGPQLLASDSSSGLDEGRDTPPDPFGRLSLDTTAERETATLRLVAAGTTLLGAIGVALSSPPGLRWGCAILGLLASSMWVGMWARARRALGDEARHHLTLDRTELSLSEGPSQSSVPWKEVVEIEVDEDRLVLQVKRTGGSLLSVEPRYGGLGVYDLEARIRRAWEAARMVRS